MNCKVFDSAATLVHLSERFLANIERGAYPGAVGELERFLEVNSPVEMRMRLNDNGLGTIGQPTSLLMAQQKSLLQVYRLGGREQAHVTAHRLKVRMKLKMYRSHLAAMPCLDSAGRGVSGSFSEHSYAISTKTASISIMTILVMGVFAFLFFDRLVATNSRRKKRYACRAACEIAPLEEASAGEATIVDISQVGAKVRVETEFSTGQEVELRFAERVVYYPDTKVTFDAWEILAKVNWFNGSYCGVEFKSILDREKMKFLLKS